MDRVGTKDHVERETEEAERLVRPAPKVKPPRHDKRRERMDVDTDPDLDTTDKDLSKNYKTIGGSLASRVLQRWAKEDLLSVRLKADPSSKVVQVSQNTLKENPGKYELIKDEKSGPGDAAAGEDDAKAQASLQSMAKSDSEFAAILKDFTNPKSDMFSWAKSAPDTPVDKFLRGRTPPKGVKTLGDLQRVLLVKPSKRKAPSEPAKAAPAAPAKAAPAKAPPAAPAKAAPAAPAKAPPAKAVPPPAGGTTPPPPPRVPKPPVEAPTPPEEAAAPPQEAAAPAKNKKPKKPLAEEPEEPAVPAGPTRRAVSKEEQAESRETIVHTFPTRVASDLLLLRPVLHPDEVRALVADYHTAQAIPIKKVDDFRDKIAKVYASDPNTVAAPKTVKGKDGTAVPLASLPAEEQALAIRDHQVRVVGMSLGARSAIAQNLSKSGAPKDLADRLAGFLLSGRDESPEDRQKRASAEAEDIFYSGLEAKGFEPLSSSAVEKILKATDDPAAKRLAVGYFQAQDYREARRRFLNPKSKEHISEHQSPDVIAARLSKASEMLRELGARYPEGSSTQDNALTFRTRVLKQLTALVPDKRPLIQELLDEGDNDQYDKDRKKYEKALSAYQKELKQAEKEAAREYAEYSQSLKSGGDPNADPPPGSVGRLLAAGLVEPVEPRKPPRYDLQRKTPGNLAESANDLWDDLLSRTASQRPIVARVASRYLFSTYPPACAMGHNRQAVYWGVEPYAQGPASYVGWEQPQARDLGPQDLTRLLTAARGWLKTPVLATNIEGIVRDTQLRAALDLAIDTEGYASVLHPTLYNNLLARLAGEPQNETLLTVTAGTTMSNAQTTKKFLESVDAKTKGEILGNIASNYGINRKEALEEILDSGAEHLLDYVTGPMRTAVSLLMKRYNLAKTARMTMPKDTVELKQAQADHFLARLDRMASTVQEKHEQWGMPLVAAKELVNAIDKLADEFEKTAYGEQSLTIRQASIIMGTEKTAEVIQRDSDEKYMDSFANPQKPIQTEADEPYMSAYKTDDSSGVQNGSASNGRKLAP